MTNKYRRDNIDRLLVRMRDARVAIRRAIGNHDESIQNMLDEQAGMQGQLEFEIGRLLESIDNNKKE